MKIERFKATFVLATIVLMIGCINQAKAGAPSELVQIGDFSISLTDIKREKNTATLHFAITKVSDTDSGHQSLQVTLMDDHRNEYSGNLDISLEGASDVVLNALSKGFTYVDMVSISMPKIAPIETIKLGDIKEISFKKVKFDKPQFIRSFGHLAITKGQSVGVGKWLSFTMEQILPAPGHWELPITIENREYNPLPAGVKVAVQHGNGTISWSHNESITVPALSKTSVKVALPIASWVKVGPPQPKVLLNVYSDRSPDKGKTILRIFPMTLGDLPPLVGQGPEEIEDVFLQAYKRNGAQEKMGNPLDLPHWFAGGDKPKEENDVLIQEFAATPDSGKSAMVWDKQGGAKKAYVLRSKILEAYLETGGPHGSLGKLIADQAVVQSHFETEGTYASFERGMLVSHHGEVYTLSGRVLEKWGEKELARGPLGFPIGDQRATTSGAHGFDTTGRVQEFEGGHIYYLTSGDYAGHAYEIHGDIEDFYMNEMRGHTGWLGFPIQDCYGSPEETRGYFEFEAGYMAAPDRKIFQVFHYESGKIAFVSDRDGNAEIYVTDASGRKQVNLTKNPTNEWGPAWSPDGSQIAFVRGAGFRLEAGIYLMNADGTNQRFLVEGKDPSWFPDGSRIVYSKGGRIFTIKPDGTEKHAIIPDRKSAKVEDFDFLIQEMSHISSVVSPDGTRIAFAGYWDYGHAYRAYVMNLDGTNVKRPGDPCSYGYKAASPSWSPDGQEIAFRVDTWGYFVSLDSLFGEHMYGGDLYVTEVDTPTKAVKLEDFCYGRLSWIPDGTAIVYGSKGLQISIMRISNKIVRWITQKGQNWDPHWWSPSSRPYQT